MEKRGSLRERLEKRKLESQDGVNTPPIENNTTNEEVEVIELFDDNGESLNMELLQTVEYNGKSYLVLTPFIEDEMLIDTDIPATVFIMQEEFQNGNERLLNPVEDESIVEKVFAKFKKQTNGNYALFNKKLSAKQDEADTILAQVQQKMSSTALSDAQKTTLAQVANKLNKAKNGENIAVIDVAIAEVKAAMNPVSTNQGTGTKPGGGKKKVWIWVIVVFAAIQIVPIVVRNFKDRPIPKTEQNNNLIEQEKGKDYIVGDWKGVYTSGNYGNKFYITLHINPDMSGIEEISRNGNTGKCAISVDYSNGTVKITEKAWTKSVSFWSLGYLQGEIVDGKIKGKACGKYESYADANGELILEKVTTAQISTEKKISEISSQGQSYSSSSTTSGRFPQASERLLSTSDISGLSKYDLKIMRNEIFARYGYIFTTSDMKNYFQNQSWYSPRYNNVASMLTSTEQKNIALIKRYE
ncbi:hypothetical protein FACS189437_06920 [Bacteroidia bacterium]|nr:hypothetical protein FACS189437_06920 [Bacteroidia bacterium]